MAKKNFILQGVTSKTHVQAVRELFDVPDIKKAILSVAFVSESGVQQIENQLKAHAALVTVYAGIRNDITSHQGLALLHDIGVKLYTVDTGSRNVIFHPKLYLVRGKATARFVVGSANLTLGGLNNNIEASLVIDFDLANTNDKAVVDEIEAQLTSLPTEYPDHVVKAGTIASLDELLASGRLVDEMAITPPRPSTSCATKRTRFTGQFALHLQTHLRRKKGLLPRAQTRPRALQSRGSNQCQIATLALHGWIRAAIPPSGHARQKKVPVLDFRLRQMWMA